MSGQLKTYIVQFRVTHDDYELLERLTEEARERGAIKAVPSAMARSLLLSAMGQPKVVQVANEVMLACYRVTNRMAQSLRRVLLERVEDVIRDVLDGEGARKKGGG